MTPDLILSALELAFVVYATEEFQDEEGFPTIEKVSRLVDAIASSIGDDREVSAEDILNALFEKYNIQ